MVLMNGFGETFSCTSRGVCRDQACAGIWKVSSLSAVQTSVLHIMNLRSISVRIPRPERFYQVWVSAKGLEVVPLGKSLDFS